MTQKKTQSKRTNGAVKGEFASTEAKEVTPKTRVRKSTPKANGQTAYTLSDDEVARKAYALWEDRGRPLGSPEEDWYRAKEQLSASA